MENENVKIDSVRVKFKTKIDTVYIEKVIVDTVYKEVVRSDTVFVNTSVVDTVYIEKVKIDTVRIFSGVRDSVYLQKVRELERSQSKLKTLQNSNKAHAHLLNSLKYYYAGKYNDAISECKMAIQISPKLSLAYIRLGSIYLKLGKIEQAKANYKKAKQLDPLNSELQGIDPRFFE